MNIKIRISKKNIIAILILLILVLSIYIWFGELGTNKEVPKKAKYVGNFMVGSDIYQ